MAAITAPVFEEHTIELIYEDGEPLETNWHRIQINLLIELARQAMLSRGRTDFFAGGNMFIYFSFEQVRTQDYRGPDFFFVSEVDGHADRKAWVVWEERGRYPNVIVELLSPATALSDKTVKKALYARTFRTPEYFWYDPIEDELRGWRLRHRDYAAIVPDERGWLWSNELELWLGRWEGERTGVQTTWLRFYDAAGHLVPTEAEAERQRAEAASEQAEAERQRAEAASEQAEAERQRAEAERQRAETASERAEAERQRAEAERQRAEAAEEKATRLRARLAKLGVDPNNQV